MTTRIKLRRDTATNWTNANPVLALGEAGYDTTNNALRIGDGTTAWTGLTPLVSSSGGNVLLSQNGDYRLTITNNGYLVGGTEASPYNDITIGNGNDNVHATLYISQDGPYIRSEVTSTTNQNYHNDMVHHNPYFSRYSKVTTDAYGVHIKNVQWYGPGTDYRNEWTFTRDGILDLPQAAEIRVNPIPPYVNGNSPYNSADQNLTITANVVNISGGRLDVGGSQQGGFIGVLGPVSQNGGWDGYWYEAVATDTGGNVYAAGGSYDNNHTTIVTKFDPEGNQLWSKYLRDSNNGNNPFPGEPNSIDFDGTNVIVTTNYYGNPNSVLVLIINPDTGALTSTGGIEDPQTNYGIDVTDVALASSFGNGPIFAGVRSGGRDTITPDVSGITQTISNRLIVAADTFTGNLTPDARFGNWYMYGTGITGNVAINNVNNFVGVSAIRIFGDGGGNDATFDVSYTPGGAYHVTVNYPGTLGYMPTDVLKIPGTLLGGATPANDLTFDVTGTYDSTIISVGSGNGTATTNWALGLSGNPVDFTSIATPTILVYQNQSGFMQWNNATTIAGNVGQTQINSIAQEYNTTDGNVYVGGYSYPGYGDQAHAFITKFNYDGGEPVWTVAVDDHYHYGEVTGVVSDTDKAVISVADNYEGQIIVTKVSTDGVMVWQRSINVASYLDSIYGIALGDDNSVLITGQVRTLEYNNRYHLMITKITKDGNFAWSRTLGAGRNAGSWWEWNHRDITTDDKHFYVNGWAKGLGLNQGGSDNGFVIKLPLDGTGVGRYGDWTYSQYTVDMAVVTNTSANVINIPFRTITSGDEAFTLVGSATNFNMADEGSNHMEYNLGGPGEIMGVGTVEYVTKTITTSAGQTTEIDLTKTINKLTPTGGGSTGNGVYHLANGYEGQIMYLVPHGQELSGNEYTGINIDNVRYRSGNSISEGSGNYWLPFQGPSGTHGSTVVTLIFTDGHWNLPHNDFD